VIQVATTKVCRVVANKGYQTDYPVCSNLVGATAIGATCSCGYKTPIVKITKDSGGQYCKEGTGGKGYQFTAALAACASTDGSADNTVAAGCACGTAEVVKVAQNKVCTVSATGVGSEIGKRCAAQDGSAASTLGADCSCGVSGANVIQVATTKVCRVVANKGYQTDYPVCSNLVGATAIGATCSCGYKTPIVKITKDSGGQYCLETAAGTGHQLVNAQCPTNEADGATAASATCACGTTDNARAGYCAYCWAAGNYFSTGAAPLACATTDGSQKHKAKPNACKCGTADACAFDKVCYTDASAASGTGKCRSTVLTTCSNEVGASAVTDDCLCGTAKADKDQFCIASINAANTAQLANCADAFGRVAVAAGVACKCGPVGATGTARSDDICAAGQFCDGSQAGTGNTGANGKCLTTAAAAPAADTTAGTTTMTQAVTFSGLFAAQWTGGLKTAGEIGYAKAQGWTTGAGAAIAIATGFTVTSDAARRAATVTFTSTFRASPAAVTAAKSAVTAASLNANMASVNSAKSLGATIPAAGTITVATAASTTATAPAPAPATVSGASTVTTSIMAMAVAVLAAFQARQ